MILAPIALWFLVARPTTWDTFWSAPLPKVLERSVQNSSADEEPATSDPLPAAASRRAGMKRQREVTIAERPRVPDPGEHRTNLETVGDEPTVVDESVEDVPAAPAASEPTPATALPSSETEQAAPAKAGGPAEALDMPVGTNFRYTTIQDVVNYLTERTGVTFQLDMKSLWYDQGATRNMSVTMDSERMPVRELLDKVVIERMKAAYVIRDGKIVITSRKAAKGATGDGA